MHCPDQETLLEFFAGRLAGAELAEVEEHIAGCGACGNELALLEQVEASRTVQRVISPIESVYPSAGNVGADEVELTTVLGGKYRLIREIGRGAMGVVFEAQHERLAARFAVKLLIARVARSSQAFARFEQEARLTSKLQHPNVVRLFDFDETTSGRAYVVMEYLDGVDLATYQEKRGLFPFAETAELVAQIAAGLHAVHREGIVHRDLKPQNIIIVADECGRPMPKLVDFGLAKVIEGAQAVTDQRTLIGTPRYMAPEQIAATTDIGPATDQFALAAITYELLVGKPPFAGETLELLVSRITNSAPVPLKAHLPETPPHWDAAVARALAKKPGDRFRSVVEFAEALRSQQSTALVRSRASRIGGLAAAGAVLSIAGAFAVKLGARHRQDGANPIRPSPIAEIAPVTRPIPSRPPVVASPVAASPGPVQPLGGRTHSPRRAPVRLKPASPISASRHRDRGPSAGDAPVTSATGGPAAEPKDEPATAKPPEDGTPDAEVPSTRAPEGGPHHPDPLPFPKPRRTVW